MSSPCVYACGLIINSEGKRDEIIITSLGRLEWYNVHECFLSV